MKRREPMRGALIGCGFVSRFHLEAWKLAAGAEIVAVCDVDAGRLERASRLVPGAARHLDARALFASGRVDFVEICTGPESHRGLVELAASHGAHVLCQKPAAFTRADLLAMIEACGRHGVRLMFHENWRFRTWNRALRGAIDAGAIGRPIRLRIAHRDTRALRPDGFSDQPFLASRPQLILMEMGCHLVDAARYLLGEVKSVSAALGHFGPGGLGDDVATLLLAFENGALGLLDMSWCAPADLARPEWALNETVVEGEAGALKLQTDGSLLLVNLDLRTERITVDMPPDERVYLQAYLAAQTHFIEGILDDAAHETCGSDTLRTMDVVWAAYRSAREGRTVAL